MRADTDSPDGRHDRGVTENLARTGQNASWYPRNSSTPRRLLSARLWISEGAVEKHVRATRTKIDLPRPARAPLRARRPRLPLPRRPLARPRQLATGGPRVISGTLLARQSARTRPPGRGGESGGGGDTPGAGMARP